MIKQALRKVQWSWLILFGLLSLFFALLFFGLRSHSQSFYFQDETEHLTHGWMVITQGRLLYETSSTNHQPLPILSGAVISLLSSSDTLYRTVEVVRYSMLIFHFIGAIVLVARFRWLGLMTALFYLSWSYYLLGWYVLAESLVLPAVAFVVLWMSEHVFSFSWRSKRWPVELDAVLFAVSLWWIVFSLLPAIPFSLGAGLAYLYWSKTTQEKTWLIATGLGAILALFSFISLPAWWQETVINNWRYFLPDEATKATWLNKLESIFYPFYSWLQIDQPLHRFLGICGVATIFVLYQWWTRQKTLRSTRKILELLFFLGLILSLNTRVYELPALFYRGFHLYPYIVGLSVLTSWAFLIFWSQPQRWIRWGTGLLFVLLLTHNLWWITERKDRLLEHHIQYTRFQTHATIILLLAHPESTLLTGPDGHGYIHLAAQIPLAGRQLFHLPWSYKSPKLRQEFFEMMAQKPPTFIYFPESATEPYYQALAPYLRQEYLQLQETDSHPTHFFVHKTHAARLNDEQRTKLRELGYWL